LNKAKAQHAPYTFYAAPMNRAVQQRLDLETRIRNALDNREFELHYQPKVSLKDETICGAEALLRWPDRDGNRPAPEQIVRVLEDIGGIMELGRWAFEQATRDRASLISAGLDVPPIAVNVSAAELIRSDFVEDLTALTNNAHNKPGIELEITESVLMRDVESSLATLQRIRKLGISIAIDDFGTGYSSLSYLLRLPVNALKIDKSFVRGMTESSDAAHIVSTLIILAHSMGLRVIAEGVETAEQVRQLRAFACDEIQGFVVSPAVPASAFADLLRRGVTLD